MSFSLGKIHGISIRVHYSLILIFFLIAFSLAIGYMPQEYPGLSRASYWAIGIISGLILIVSIIIHELCHSIVANRLGLHVRRITLFFLGGASELPEEPKSPMVELKMAIAGPLSSFVIAGCLAISWYLLRDYGLMVELIAVTHYGAIINLILGAFNLLPAFPLDGGRVLRSILWKVKKSIIKATKTASRISVAISYAMMFVGFIMIIFGGFFNGLWIIFIGWFIKSGAEAGLSQTIIGQTLSSTTLNDIMSKDVVIVNSDLSLDNLVKDYFLVRRFAGYPVLKDSIVIGMVTMDRLKNVSQSDWREKTVEDVMKPIEELIVMEPDTPASDAMYAMARKEEGRVLVMEENQLMGIVSRKDLTHLIKTRVEIER